VVTAELKAARGAEEEIFNMDEDKKFVGKHTLREYLEANRDIWIK
jgi:festuclavine dehydrogenase